MIVVTTPTGQIGSQVLSNLLDRVKSSGLSSATRQVSRPASGRALTSSRARTVTRPSWTRPFLAPMPSSG